MPTILGFFSKYQDIFTIVLLYLVAEITFSWIIKYRKKKYISPFSDSTNPDSSDFYLLYYQKVQYIQVFRVCIIISLVGLYLAWNNVYIFGGIGIAAGAIVITFSKQLVGLFNYLQILSEFKVGQTIKIDDFLGEIIAIQPLEMKLSGKNEQGEHNGYLFQVPMYIFSEKIIQRIDVSPNAIQKSILRIPYSKTLYSIDFDTFLINLETFLKTFMIKTTYTSAGHYESYIGVRYKYSLEYLDNGTIIINLGFLGTRQELHEKTKKIFIFLEQMK